jgi:hypothetical protein
MKATLLNMSKSAALIYIVGSGRSGSTVVERILDSAPGVVSVGEISSLWRVELSELMCSCGERMWKCPFWSAVMSDCHLDSGAIRSLHELEHAVVRNKFLIANRFDVDAISDDFRVSEYTGWQELIYSSVRRTSGQEIIVDSSKSGPRAWLLLKPFDPMYLHVYRHPRDVIASWRKPKFEKATSSLMKQKSVMGAAVDWVKVEQSARFLARKGRLSRLNYLDFCREPKEALRSALSRFRQNIVDDIAWIDSRSVQPSQNYHTIGGNPDRYINQAITIKETRVNASEISRRDAVMATIVGWALARVYA